MHMCAHTGDTPMVLESGRASCGLLCVRVCVPACTRNVPVCAHLDGCVAVSGPGEQVFAPDVRGGVGRVRSRGITPRAEAKRHQRALVPGVCVSVLACLRVAAHVSACLCTRVCVCVVHRRVIQGLLFWVLGHVLPRTE